jgi:hypothetical protein
MVPAVAEQLVLHQRLLPAGCNHHSACSCVLLVTCTEQWFLAQSVDCLCGIMLLHCNLLWNASHCCHPLCVHVYMILLMRLCACVAVCVQGRQQAQQQHDSSDDEHGGKLSALQQNKKQQQQPRQAGSSIHQLQPSKAAPKVFDRAQLLAVPVANLSKWQRKQMRKKEKLKAAAAAQQH